MELLSSITPDLFVEIMPSPIPSRTVLSLFFSMVRLSIVICRLSARVLNERARWIPSLEPFSSARTLRSPDAILRAVSAVFLIGLVRLRETR